MPPAAGNQSHHDLQPAETSGQRTGVSPRQTAVLRAVCEALLPDADAIEPTMQRLLALVARLPDPGDRRRLGLLLGLLDCGLVNGCLGSRWRAITRLERAERETLLRQWAESRWAVRRAGFQALKRLVHVAHYCWPQPDGSHPAWQRTGYPGPLALPDDVPPPLPVRAVQQDTVLDCDVVVCGSGAGGGVAAGVLAQAGRDVVVLEMGPNPDPRQFTQVEGEMLSTLYLDGGLLMTRSGSMPVLAGSCLGGGTVINYTTSLPLPEDVRAEWDVASGTRLFTSPRFAGSLDRVSMRLGVSTRWNTPGNRDLLLERGCHALGWHVGAQPRNVTDCREGLECGYCGYGCRHGAKNSTERTYLADGARAGARLVVQARVERVVIERGRALGVVAAVRGPDGRSHRLEVRARAVVAACGALHTPALLSRSGLRHARLGRGLYLHPATAVLGIFPERVEPWSGALQTRYSEEFARRDGGYGFRFETAPVHFALPASGFGWEGAAAFQEALDRLAWTSLAGILLRDRDAGRVRVAGNGRPVVCYDLSRRDAAQVREGVVRGAELLAAAGATEVVTLHTPPVRVNVGVSGWRERLLAAADGLGYRQARLSYVSFHQMGTAALGSTPARGVAGENGEVFGVSGLYLADASLFPGSSGVNPMLTIMALADHVARTICETW
jgi:choline dehydrogenase-like flavoprotein